jgi:type IV secretion system protein VirB10
MLISSHRHAVRDAKPEPKPVAQDSVVEPLKLPPLPKPQPVVYTPPMPPALPTVGPSNLAGPKVNAAYESEVMAISSQQGGEAGSAKPHGHEVQQAGVQSELGARLTPTPLVGSRAVELPNPDFLISQGRQIPCTQQTAINTSYPGAVTAIIPHDIRGDTGHVVLLNAGSRIFGTIEHGITNGLSRVFVLWQRITTPPLYDEQGMPHAYAIQANSPAADEAGATGLEGDVNRHWMQKLGGVLALSLIQGGINAGVAAAQQPGSTNINLGSFTGGSDQLASTLLQSTIQIPDTLTRPQGGSCTLFVARDLDLGNVFGIRRKR